MFVGIDFGTSNSSIAVCDGDNLRFFDLDPRHLNPRVLPSFTYITKDHDEYVGIQAIDTYLEEETGRKPVWESRSLGQIEITVGGPGSGPITYNQALTVEVDVAANGRLLQSIKTALRDPDYEGTQIFDRFYKIEELIAMLLTALRKRCEHEIGHPVDQAVIGRPVKYSDDPAVNRRAQNKMLEAAKLAGFRDVVLELEPIGGAYLYHQTRPHREWILVFDFGGGTLDMTIVEVGGTLPPTTIATQGVLLGGDDLTAALMRTLFRSFGEGSILPDGLPFPTHIFEMLQSWQSIVELSRPRFAHLFEQGKRGSRPLGIKRLEMLATRQLGFQLFQHLERAKMELSSSVMTWLEFFEDALYLKELVIRSRFESLIHQEVAQVERALDELLLKSGLKPEQITGVLRTGGSSEIPIFIELLERRFGPDRIKELNPFTTIVGGLALKGRELNTR
jgi:hypothetical chaperone protein